MMKASRLAINPSVNLVEAGKGSPASLSFVLGVSPLELSDRRGSAVGWARPRLLGLLLQRGRSYRGPSWFGGACPGQYRLASRLVSRHVFA